jgi:hypothetical protein
VAPEAPRAAKSDAELVRLFAGTHTEDGGGRHEPYRRVVGVLLARGGRFPPDVLLELAVSWAKDHTNPCKPRAELERNFSNLLARELSKRGFTA